MAKRKAADKKLPDVPSSPAARKKKINAAMDAMVENLITAATDPKRAGSIASIDAFKQLQELAGADQGEEYKIDLIFVPIVRLDDGKYSVIPLKQEEPNKDAGQKDQTSG